MRVSRSLTTQATFDPTRDPLIRPQVLKVCVSCVPYLHLRAPGPVNLAFGARNVAMSTEASQFKKEDHAAIYLKNRPGWPPEIVQRSLSFLREKTSEPFQLAVDVGCGSGQNTRPLAPYFEKVIGVDVSEAQIRAAQSLENPPNVEFRIEGAESIAVPDRSVDLITCAESVHWFDLDAFFREMDRILKPNGCIAIYAYHKIRPWVEGDDVKNEQLKDVVMQLSGVTLGSYNSPGARHLFNRLADIHIPYDENIRDESLNIQYDTTMASYMDYIQSWSAYQAYLEKNPSGPDILKEVQERLMELLSSDCSPEDAKIRVRSPVVLLLGRKPQEETCL